MANSVGPKGQVVIEKAIRDQFGVEQGWETVQIPADDHVKVYFIPPPHRQSLLGCLSQYVTLERRIVSEEEWDRARADAWEEASSGRFGAAEETA